jgi:hypothetical protein
LGHSSAIENGWEVSFGHQCSTTKLMKMDIYSPLNSPPVMSCTSNKPNEVDLMSREWFSTTCLQMRVAERGCDVDKHKTPKLDQDGHLLSMHLPPPAAHTSNEPNAANSVGYEWFWTRCLCGWAAAGEVDVINIIFCTQ